MRILNAHTAAVFLQSQGLSATEAANVLKNYDLREPIYEQTYWPGGTPLYQLVRRPSAPPHPKEPDDAAAWKTVNGPDFGNRGPLHGVKFSAVGNWFGLAGIRSGGAENDQKTDSGVAINDSYYGRSATKFEVIAQFTALEGIAADLPRNLGNGIGGRGGQTQIYVPNALLFRLEYRGEVERWV